MEAEWIAKLEANVEKLRKQIQYIENKGRLSSNHQVKEEVYMRELAEQRLTAAQKATDDTHKQLIQSNSRIQDLVMLISR